MIASVKSEDGYTLYVKVQAKPAQFKYAQDQLRAVAAKRTRSSLLADDYYTTPEDAANSGGFYRMGTPVAVPA
jgi:hypothetical protein